MKKGKYILFIILCGIIGLLKVNAASFNVSASPSTVVVGNTVTVTVNVTGNEVGAWTYCLSYDSSKLTFVSSTANGGGTCVNDGVVDLVSRTTTFKFKAKASGTSTVSLSSAVAYDYNTELPLTATKGSVNVTARTQAEIEASYSTNANLKSITVSEYELKPEFKKDVLEYSVEVENEVESVVVTAVKEDNAAHVAGDGEILLTEGLNKVVITVTAEKGNKQEYVVNITRKELDPINVHVNGNNFTVVRKADALETINYYSATTTIIDDIEVPAFKSDITGYVLVGLKNEHGDIALYRYDESTGEFFLYVQLPPEALTIIPEEPTELLLGYEASKELVIKGYSIKVYYKADGSTNFVLVYGMNAATGVRDWYQYDIEDGTFQRFQSKEIIKLQEDLKDYFLLVVLFAVGLGLSILLVIILLVKNTRAKRKNIKLLTMLENGQVLEKNLVVEEVPEDEELPIEEIVEIKPMEEPVEEEEVVESKKEKKKKKEKNAKKKKAKEESIVEEPIVEEIIEETVEPIEEEPIEEVEETTIEEPKEEVKKTNRVRGRAASEKKLSQRELNRLEKQRQRDLEEMGEQTQPKTRRGRRNTDE